MMKPKYLLFSAALLAMTQAVALTPVRKQTQMPAAKKQVNKATLLQIRMHLPIPLWARILSVRFSCILQLPTRDCISLILQTMKDGWM